MRKILLVIDDFQDLVSLENLLRRLGFDVLSLGKEVLINDALLRFAPDLVITNFKSRSVDGLRIAAKLKRSLSKVRVGLTYPSSAPPNLTVEAQGLVDALIPFPVQASNVIRVVAQLLDLDANPLLEKFKKLSANRTLESVSALIGSSSGEAVTEVADHGADDGKEEWVRQQKADDSNEQRTSRSDRYDQFLAEKNPDPALGVITAKQMAQPMKKLKAASEGEKEMMEKINAEKKAFIDAMFGKDD